MSANKWAVLLFASALSVTVARADSTSYTPAAGYFALSIQGQSDNHLSVPLAEKVVAFGKLSAVSQDTLTVRAKKWISGGFRVVSGTQNVTYYAEFASGALKGIRYRILDNSEDTLLLATQGDDFTAHPMGSVAYDDVIRIRPVWTIGSLLGATESEAVLDPKTDPTAAGDSVLMLDGEGVGQNKAPKMEISYVHNVGWRATGDATTDQVHQPFETGRPLVIRRLNAQTISFAVIGHVLTGMQSMYVPGGDGISGNDAYVSLLFPEPVSVSSSGLFNSTNAANSVVRSSKSKLLRNDELLAYKDTVGFDLAPERSFFYLEGAGWREVGNAATTAGTDFLLEPGKSYIVRKKAANLGVEWLQSTVN